MMLGKRKAVSFDDDEGYNSPPIRRPDLSPTPHDEDDDDDDEESGPAPKSTTIRLGSYTSGPLDPITGQRGALPVSNDLDRILLNYDEDGPPDDGLSYLRLVRREAESYPNYVTVRSNLSSSVASEYPSKVTRSNNSEFITREWHVYIMDQYRTSRSLLEASNGNIDHSTTRADLPDSLATWREFIQSSEHAPSMSIVSVLEQEDVFRLFKYFLRWVTPNMSLAMSRWLFALLVRAADLLPANEISILRQLAQKCILLRTENKPLTNLSRATLDSVISIVADFYSQRDLAPYLFEIPG